MSDSQAIDGGLQIPRWAAVAPEAPALLAPGREPISFARLSAFLAASRQALRDNGLRPGDIAALVTAQTPNLLTAFLAIAGECACAPLDPSLTEDEYRFYLSSLGAQTLVVEQESASPAVTAARELGMRVLRIRSAIGDPAGVFALDAGESPLAMAKGRQTDASLLLYTSATTSHPKLVPLTAAHLHAIVSHTSLTPPLTPADRYLTLMPALHAHGLCSALTTLFCGGSVACVSGFEAASFLAWMDELRPTWFTANSAMMRLIRSLAHQSPERIWHPPLRFIRAAGTPPEPELIPSLELAVQLPVLQSYGMTEAVGIARATPDARKPGSVGRSIGLDIAIVDESGNPLPVDCEGEIVLRGPMLMSGYLDDPEANQAAFRNGWFHTGDLGRLDSDGFLFLTGRIKEMINRGGQKILPNEVDAVLARHPQVADVAAFAVPHLTLGEEVAAAVVLSKGATASGLELRRFASVHIAAFKIPRWIVFVDSIPRGSTGKPKRAALADLYRDLAAVETTDAFRPLEAVETRLVEIWKRVLGIPHVGVDDDFFRLGGDSLSAALMLAEVEKALKSGQDLFDKVEFFDQPTLASLARLLAEGGAELKDAAELEGRGRTRSPQDRVLPVQRRGSRTPLFCFPASTFDPFYLRHLSKGLGNEQPFYAVYLPDPLEENRLLKIEELAQLSVAAIRSVQPNGPCVIAGHCFGGVVAFETARQLLAQGQHVDRLVLFDVPAPGYPKVTRSWRKYFKESGSALAAWVRGERLAEIREAFLHVGRLRDIVTRKFKGRTSRALASVGSDTLIANRPLKELNSMALWEYVPKEFPAPMALFIAADEPISTRILDDPRLGWRDFARGGLELRTVRGGHNSIFSAEHAPALAAELAPLLHHAESSVRAQTATA